MKKWTAALWELHIGRRYVGHVEKMYSGRKPWVACDDNVDELGRYPTRRAAQRRLESFANLRKKD